MSTPTVHLVHPPPYGEVPFKHIGLCYVAAGLRADGFETRYHDLSERLHRRGLDFYDDLILWYSRRAGAMSDLPFLELLGHVLFPEHGDSALAERIRAQVDEAMAELGDARVVGLTFNTLTTYAAAALGRRLRASGAKVFLGGPLARIDALSHLMLHLGAADVVVEGEGDRVAGPVVKALLAGRAPVDVPGALWLADGKVARNPVGPPCLLDELPWPELEGNLVDQFVPIHASRGCPRRCVFCSESGIWEGQTYRRRDPQAVVREMDTRSAALGLTDFHFHDDLLNGSRRWLEEFVAAVSGHGHTWESFFEPYGLDEGMLERMADAGCRLVKYGIQSFSPEVLGRMGRASRIQAILDVVVKTYHLGISTHYDMLIGHPGESEEDHRTNLRVVDELYDLTGERLYFSLNPYYLAAGSAVAREPERFGVTLLHAPPSDFPAPLAAALAASPPYPVGYHSDVDRDTLMRRMDELAQILRKHGKDYLYLGQDALPDTGRTDRRMLPPLPEDGAVDDPAAEAWARGADEAADPVLALAASSNLKLWATPGRLPLAAPEGAPLAELRAALARVPEGRTVRLLGGEPTLARDLPAVLATAQQLARPCRLETNGLRFSQPAYTEALVRHGLTRATVLFLAPEAPLADRLGGREGSFALALEGARALANAGVEVELGLVATVRTVGLLPMLAALAAEQLPGVRTLRVVLAPLGGPGAPDLPSRQRLNPSIAALVADAARRGQTVIVEDRT